MRTTSETIVLSTTTGYTAANVTSSVGVMSVPLFEIMDGISVSLSDIGQLSMLIVGLVTFVVKYLSKPKKDKKND